jgi:hypothetical protein
VAAHDDQVRGKLVLVFHDALGHILHGIVDMQKPPFPMRCQICARWLRLPAA